MSTGLNGNLEALFEKMEHFVTTKTVVGEPILFDNIVIVPLVDVSFGVGAGAKNSDSNDKGKGELGAGGLGAKITPAAVIVINNGTVQLINVKSQDSVNKLIEMVPGVMSKLNFSFGKKKEEKVVPVESAKFEETLVTE